MGVGHLPELAGEIRLLLRREGLVAEEDHMVRVQGLAHGGDHRRREGHGEIDTPDLSPDVGREWMHTEAGGEGHGAILPEIRRYLNPARSRGPTLSANEGAGRGKGQ